MKYDLQEKDSRELHYLLMSSVVPRPIAWVSTVSGDGVFNLAPFSAYCVMSINPAIVGFGVAMTRDGKIKDTLANIEATKEFVISVVDEDLAEAMNISAAPYPSEVDEFTKAGMTPVMADLVKVPMVSESPIKMECSLNQILEFGEAPATNRFVVGEILRIHVKDEMLIEDDIQMAKLKAIGRMGGRGGDHYCRTTDRFEMPRPKL
jgi:flavin reductase (DIM6/NTAB) family NADH-FMN oxidoreductase RutF